MRRPRLTPAMADVRRAIRAGLSGIPEGGLVLVALSGGPDSLALAAGTAFEAPRAGLRAGAAIVDHGLQPGSAGVAARAAGQAAALGLDPVRVVRCSDAPADIRAGDVACVAEGTGCPSGPQAAPGGNVEARARDARYAALAALADELGAAAVLLGHTLDDQAETVLLGLARGAGATSLQGMRPVSGRYRRPLLGVRREATVAACADQGLVPWDDPMNEDPAFARVRVRRTVLPLLERELGPGVATALARTAEQLQEDAAALDAMADEVAEDLVLAGVDPVTEEPWPGGGISLPVAALAANPAALRHRLIRLVVRSEFGVALTRERTLEVARLVADWHGQGPIELPGVSARREGGFIVFAARPDQAAPTPSEEQ